MKITLFSGPQCCLCEQAIELINALERDDLKLSVQNVRDSVDLYHLYGARIPVVKREDNKLELAWPFTLQGLALFLA